MKSQVNSQAPRQFGNYLLCGQIGSGSYAQVKKAINLQTQSICALQIIKQGVKTYDLAKLYNEISLMMKLKHNNIVRVLDFVQDETYVKSNGDSFQTMAIALQYLPGDNLFKYLKETQNFQQPLARLFFYDILVALIQMNQMGVAHRDLKPENLIFDQNFCLKVCDFGLAKSMENGNLVSSVGTPRYAAPQLLIPTSYSGTYADIFSAGVILFKMVVGNYPFSMAQTTDLNFRKIAFNEFDEFWADHFKTSQVEVSSQFQNLINSMLNFDSKQRPSLSDIVNHPWMQQLVPERNIVITTFNEIQNKIMIKDRIEQANQNLLQMQQELQKKSSPTNNKVDIIHTGIQGFRSSKAPDEGLADWMNQQRTCQILNKDFRNDQDFVIKADPWEIFEYLIVEQQNNYSNKVHSISEFYYKFKASSIIQGDQEEVDITIQLLQLEEDDSQNDDQSDHSIQQICVQFSKNSGDEIEYFNKIEQIKSIILNFFQKC